MSQWSKAAIEFLAQKGYTPLFCERSDAWIARYLQPGTTGFQELRAGTEDEVVYLAMMRFIAPLREAYKWTRGARGFLAAFANSSALAVRDSMAREYIDFCRWFETHPYPPSK